MNHSLITPMLKDNLLADLLSVGDMKVGNNINRVAKEFQTTPGIVEAIYDQFVDMGLMNQVKCIGGNVFITLTAKAHDLFRQGGFSAQEELFKANLEKLGMELDLLAKQLSPDLSQKASELSTIAANVLSALSFIPS